MDTITLRHPRQRLIKKQPNPVDVIMRAVASVSTDPSMSTSLLDITSMSFSIRERVYGMAKSSASISRKVIVIFGADRF